jgi:hypothetical protein
MSISLRYWSRWFIEKDVENKIYPALLVAGDSPGISPTEFPFLNFLTAPAFYFSIETGRYLAQLLLMLMLLALVLANMRVWKGIELFGISVPLAVLGTPVIGLAFLHFNKFIPDVFAMYLCFLALGLSWTKPRYFLSFLFASLGLLVKPTSVVVFAWLLFQRRSLWMKSSVWLILAVGVTVAYYTLGVSAIREVADISYFRVAHREVWLNFIEIFEDPKRIISRINFEYVTPFFPVLFFMGFLGRQFRDRASLGLLAIFAVQFLILAIISGEHMIEHSYYLAGITPTMAMLFVNSILTAKRLFRILFTFSLVIGFGSFVVYEVAPVFDKGRTTMAGNWLDCSKLIERNPQVPWKQGYRFRTKKAKSAILGMCFGEIQNSQTSNWGFYFVKDTIPEDCQVVDTASSIRLVKCGF